MNRSCDSQSDMADGRLKVCICGGGNGAHALAGLAAAHAQFESRVLTLYQDEASRWRKMMADDGFVISIKKPEGGNDQVRSRHRQMVGSEFLEPEPHAICQLLFRVHFTYTTTSWVEHWVKVLILLFFCFLRVS